jgi:murein L,D-transpeptidase YafK
MRWRAGRSLVALWLISGSPPRADEESPDRCLGRGTTILIDVRTRQLHLCQDDRTRRAYAVALGRGGAGKHADGDSKTPLGTYPLGTPRRSERFDTFIPVGYPTLAQRRRGATGGAVGIHGPRHAFAWAGRANTWVDWTRGCIAVATDGAIREIAAWVRDQRPASVSIE